VDSHSIWSSAARVCPDSYKTHKSLANALYGRDPQRRRLDEVIAVAERGRAIVEREPVPLARQSGDVYASLGAYFVEKGELTPLHSPQRAESYRRAVELLEHVTAIERAVTAELARHSTQDLSGLGDFHVYGNLGVAYLRLGEFDRALAAYQRMHRLAPTESKGYLGAAFVNAGLGRRQEAITCALQALLLDTSNQSVWQILFDFYRQAGLASQAIRMNNGQPQLDVSAPLVKEQICAAYRGLIQNCRAAGANKLAAELTAAGGKEYGCPPSQ
jgi:tetratricopeptide (TPR) repeat protein